MKAWIELREEHYLGEWHWRLLFGKPRVMVITPLIPIARNERQARREAEKVAKMLGLEVEE